MPKFYEGEFPDPGQKLATKFILDSLKRKKNLSFEEPVADSIQEEQLSPAIKIEATDATLSEDNAPQAEFPADSLSEPKSAEPIAELTFQGDKKYFRIGEASEMLGVEPYVLRYWESEFSGIRPMKSRSGHRTYSRADLQLFSQIRHLLYVEKYSVKGAKKKLSQKRKEEKTRPMAGAKEHKNSLKLVAAELKDLIHLLGQDPGSL